MHDRMTEDTPTLTVNKEVCEGYSICLGIDSDLFELDEVEDFVHVIAQPDGAEQVERAESAVRACPKRALGFTG